MAAGNDRDALYRRFHDAVNMAPGEIEEWLETDDSRRVGFKRDGDEESVGHASGRRIVAILRMTKTHLTEDDYAHMRKVVGYVRRHCAQGPWKADILTSKWRYSLMNWGHDPLKD